MWSHSSMCPRRSAWEFHPGSKSVQEIEKKYLLNLRFGKKISKWYVGSNLFWTPQNTKTFLICIKLNIEKLHAINLNFGNME